MFIDPTMHPKTCAPAERDVSGNGTRDRLLRFAPLERGGIFCRSVFYKHYVPTGRRKLGRKDLAKKQEVRRLCFREGNRRIPTIRFGSSFL